MKRLLPLLVIAAALAIPAAASPSPARTTNCVYYCDWIPYGEQWCGADHYGDVEYGDDGWYWCAAGSHSYHWNGPYQYGNGPARTLLAGLVRT